MKFWLLLHDCDLGDWFLNGQYDTLDSARDVANRCNCSYWIIAGDQIVRVSLDNDEELEREKIKRAYRTSDGIDPEIGI